MERSSAENRGLSVRLEEWQDSGRDAGQRANNSWPYRFLVYLACEGVYAWQVIDFSVPPSDVGKVKPSVMTHLSISLS